MDTTLEKRIRSLIKLSGKFHEKNEDINKICIEIQNCIDNGVSIDHYFLLDALTQWRPLEIISLLYNNNKDAIHFSDGEITTFNHPETRNITIEYNFEFVLSDHFGDLFRFMLDEKIEDMEYVLKCLEIFQMKESDIDWDLALKSGHTY